SEQVRTLNQEVQDGTGGQPPTCAIHRQHHPHGSGNTALGIVLQLLQAHHQTDVASQQQSQGQSDRQHRLEEAHQWQHKQRDRPGDPEGATTAVDGVHRITTVLVTLRHSGCYRCPDRSGDAWIGCDESVTTVTDRGDQVNAVNAAVDVFVFTQVINTVHQGLTNHDITKGNNISDYGGRNGVQEDVQIRTTNADWQVGPQLIESRHGDTPPTK